MAIVTDWLSSKCAYRAWTGNATAAIMVLLEEMDLSGVNVAVPVNVCPSVVQAVWYSGNRPYYIDIEEDTMGMCPKILERHINKLSAVIAVHMYGSVFDIKSIAAICRKHKKILIEDCAQALGAHIGGQPVGTFGDAAVFSFGAGKIVDLGVGGAAVSHNALLIRRVRQRVASMREWSKDAEKAISEFSGMHTSIYNNFYPVKVRLHYEMLRKNALRIKDVYLFQAPCNLEDRVSASLMALDANLDLRKERALYFKDIFEKNEIEFHWPKEGGVFWRFNLFLDEVRDRLLHSLLSEGFKVSSWYPRVDIFMEAKVDDNDYSVAEKVAGRILNLWVNSEVDDQYVEAIAQRIIELKDYACNHTST